MRFIDPLPAAGPLGWKRLGVAAEHHHAAAIVDDD